MKRHYKTLSAYERVMLRTKVPENKDECWLWCGPVNNAGYGMIRGNDGVPKMTTVHRIVGIDKGLNHKKEIQHTCLTKHCVNPNHLVNGDSKTRNKRIVAKHGNYFCKPKIPYRKCKHCKQTTHVVWFNRKHNECYPGMLTKLSNKHK